MYDLIDSINSEQSNTFTTNGAATFSSSLSHNLDLFSLGAACRNKTSSEKIQLFSKAFNEDKLIALKIMFYIRDCRGGQGEREFFRVCLKWLASNYPKDVERNMENIVKFGRYDDLFILRKTPVENQMLNYIISIWKSDIKAYKNRGHVTLLAKWMPSESASSRKTITLAKWFIQKFNISERSYRKTLTYLRKYINIVEAKMSKKEWDKIDYSTVPSSASLIYKNAFQKHDAERYQYFLEQVKKGKAKINSKTLYPYDLVKHYIGSSYIKKNYNTNHRPDPTVEAQWNALPDYFEGKQENSLCVIDTSNSMCGRPLAVALSLGIYTAEKNKGLFHNHFITFSKRPTLQKIVGNSLLEKIRNLETYDWDMNTNLVATFELILSAAKKNNVARENMPKKLYIITDMEFDYCVTGQTAYNTMKEMYRQSGYSIPNVVFWNVDSKSKNIPVRYNQKGVALVSGFSPAIYKILAGAKIKSPLDIMNETINQNRYKSVVI